MRIIVCGGRMYSDRDNVKRVLSEYRYALPTIVHGDAAGADRLAARAAGALGYSVEPHPADWTGEGRIAGPLRNEQMAQAGAELCIAFPGGRGTQDMVARAEFHGIPVREVPQ